jgi:hypothetical protein
MTNIVTDPNTPQMYAITRNGRTHTTYLTPTRAHVHANAGRLVVPVASAVGSS